MVDEKTSKRTLTGFRRMAKSYAPLNVNFDNDLGQWNPPQETSTIWQQVPGAFSSWYVEDYFDTSGYTRDQLTTMPKNIFNQEAGRVNMANPGNQRLCVFDFVLTERIEDIAAFVLSFTDGNVSIPSFPSSTDDWTQVQYGRFRQFTGITQGTTVQDVFALIQDDGFGSLEPTTADKLWIYKIVVVLGLPGGVGSELNYPPSRTILEADIVAEPELEFMMRQKRSYELTNY